MKRNVLKRNWVTVLLALMSVAVMAQPPHGGKGHDEHGPRGKGHEKTEHRHGGGKHIECATNEQLHMSLQVIENQSFDEKKLEIAKLCVTLGRFCTDDLDRMARKFSFDANRKKFLSYAYRYVSDPQNYYSLRDAFEFRNNFDELMDEVRR